MTTLKIAANGPNTPAQPANSPQQNQQPDDKQNQQGGQANKDAGTPKVRRCIIPKAWPVPGLSFCDASMRPAITTMPGECWLDWVDVCADPLSRTENHHASLTAARSAPEK
jgi:hypothetical protein